jgi:hypothetical protein
LVGFPIAWDYERKGDATLVGCPYTPYEMKEYLFGAHYHYATDEEPLELSEPEYVTELDTSRRHFWLWQVGDQSKRTWYLVIGSGKSPFYGDDRHCHRWLYADEGEGENPDEFLARASFNHDLASEPL